MRTTTLSRCALVTFLTLTAATAAAEDFVVVKVNGDPVFASEVRRASQQVIQQVIASGEQPDPATLGDAAVGRVVDAVLLAQEARRRGIEVSETEVAAAVAAAEQQAGGAEQLDERLAQDGLDRARLQAMAERSILLGRFAEMLVPAVRPADDEAHEDGEDDGDAVADDTVARRRAAVGAEMEKVLVTLRETAVIEPQGPPDAVPQAPAEQP
jgi:hypothetical protein